MQKGILDPHPEEYNVGVNISNYMVNDLDNAHRKFGDDLVLI